MLKSFMRDTNTTSVVLMSTTVASLPLYRGKDAMMKASPPLYRGGDAFIKEWTPCMQDVHSCIQKWIFCLHGFL